VFPRVGVCCLESTSITTTEKNTGLELSVGFTSSKRLFVEPGTYLLGGLPRYLNTNTDLPNVCAIVDKPCSIVSRVAYVAGNDYHSSTPHHAGHLEDNCEICHIEDNCNLDRLDGNCKPDLLSMLDKSRPFLLRSAQTCKIGNLVGKLLAKPCGNLVGKLSAELDGKSDAELVGEMPTIRLACPPFVVSIDVTSLGMTACKLFLNSVLVCDIQASDNKVHFDVELIAAKEFHVCPSFASFHTRRNHQVQEQQEQQKQQDQQEGEKEQSQQDQQEDWQVSIVTTSLNFLASSSDNAMFFKMV